LPRPRKIHRLRKTDRRREPSVAGGCRIRNFGSECWTNSTKTATANWTMPNGKRCAKPCASAANRCASDSAKAPTDRHRRAATDRPARPHRVVTDLTVLRAKDADPARAADRVVRAVRREVVQAVTDRHRWRDCSSGLTITTTISSAAKNFTTWPGSFTSVVTTARLPRADRRGVVSAVVVQTARRRAMDLGAAHVVVVGATVLVGEARMDLPLVVRRLAVLRPELRTAVLHRSIARRRTTTEPKRLRQLIR